MTEKKATSKATAPKKVAVKKAAAPKKTTSAAPVLYINAESVGFRAGDVYQALAAAGNALSVAEIAKAANISVEEAYLGIGWLFKEGKVKDENNLLTLA
ncbi:winged helix-turn-helix domain-containing protein [Prevotella sp. HJM029]|uniref:winged helix-turn-helix domain-containing protein n=1 Tax=Prevotella sp. HJM029 TaxID=1433844 RepID=UPI00048EF892|nr:winged helix-turn-helix domain-containing protein [Prevotella sp. HJM029]